MPNSSGSRKSQHMGCSSDAATAALVRQEALTRSPLNHREDAVSLLCCQEDPASCMPGYFPRSNMCKFTQHPRDVLPFPNSEESLLLSLLLLFGSPKDRTIDFPRDQECWRQSVMSRTGSCEQLLNS